MVFTEFNNVVGLALAPDADLWNGDPDTDIISMENYSHCTFIVAQGVGTTGTVKMIATASDDAAGSNTAAFAAKYRTHTVGAGWGALTTLAATGYTTTAGSNQVVVIEIDAEMLPDGKPYVYIDFTEVADDPCDAGVIAILSGARYPGASPVEPYT